MVKYEREFHFFQQKGIWETIMDTIIDKLAQKKNAQEMIRANYAAEAAKMEQLQKQIKAYDETMQEMRRVNIKTAENLENMRDLLSQCVEKLESVKTEDESGADAEKQLAAVKTLLEERLAAVKTLLEERLAQTENFVHKENVKVYRNVQAAFTEELEKQAQNQQSLTAGESKTTFRLSVAILIAVAADIVINLIPLILQLMNIKLF